MRTSLQGSDEGDKVRIALLGDVSVEFFASDFRREGHEVFVPSGFGAWREAALDHDGALRAFSPEAALLVRMHPRGEDDDTIAALKSFCPRVVDVDLAALASETPGFRDARMWSTAGFPFSLDGLRAVEDEFRWGCQAAQKKVLAVDADNTLWEGIISEDGPDAVRPRVPLQEGLLSLRGKGVPLVLLTKNEPVRNGASALERAFARDDMPLALRDFAVVRSNWSPKSANLAIAAAELNIGEDAFVFIDDNPHERAEMSARIPSVAVVEAMRGDWPAVRQRQLLRRLGEYFFKDAGRTAEDRARAGMYAQEAERRRAAAAAPTLEDYLAALDLRAAPALAEEGDVPRLAQMASRTNQFNATTIRRDEADFRRLLSDPSKRVWTFRACDRYGDMGLVCYIVCDIPSARITDFVMSCRAMGRTLEDFALNHVRSALADEGVALAGIDYEPTIKNEPFGRFLASVDIAEPGRTFYRQLVAG
jgi:FkbH-like protein